MAYVPKTNWVLNDTVMPSDMNRIEQGIADNDTNKLDSNSPLNPANLSSAVPVNKGGTGATSSANARGNLDAQQRTNSLSAITEIADDDILPIYDMSVTTHKRISWTQIKNWLKTYFDKLYYVDTDTTIYISPSGNDTTGTGTSSTPYRTLTKALSVIPKNTNGKNVIISIVGGTYSENVVIKGFTGNITLTVTGTTPATFTSITVDGCSITHTGYQMNLTPGSTGTGLTLQNGAVWTGSSALYIGNGYYAIVAKSGSQLSIQQTVTMQNQTATAVDVYGSSMLYISTVSMTNNAVGMAASNGGIIMYGTASITATVGQRTSNGARIYSGAQTQVPSY